MLLSSIMTQMCKDSPSKYNVQLLSALKAKKLTYVES